MPKGLDYIINIKDGSLSGASKAKAEVQGLDNAVEQTGKSMTGLGSIARNVGGVIAGSFAISAIKGITDDILQVRGQFQGFENLLKNSLGDAGEQAFEDIKKFAASTPFEVDQLTESFIKLQGAGFNPTMEKMGALGDIAASKMKSVDQFTEAIIDAQTGEFERLKEFGIRASKQGENVTFTYNGVAKTMKFSQAATEDYLLSLADLPGISGSMAAMADTFIGRQSNVNDMMTQFKDKLGKDLEPVLNSYLDMQASGIELMQTSVDWLKQNSDGIKDVATVLGIAAGGYLLYQTYLLALQVPMAIATAGQWLLNAAMTANPIGLIVTGIGLLAGGLYVAYQRSETFRAGLMGILGVAKLLGGIMLGLGKTIIGALTLDKGMFLEGVKAYAGGIQEIAKGGISKAFNAAYDESIAESSKKATTKKDSAVKGLTAGKTLTGKTAGAGLGGGASGADASATSVSSSKQVRNVNVTIGKLVEKLEVHTTNLQGTGAADIKRMLTEILTGAVHDSELALS